MPVKRYSRIASFIFALYGGVIMIVVAFAMPQWRIYDVDSQQAASSSFDFTNREEFNYSRSYGFWKICYTTGKYPPDAKIISTYDATRWSAEWLCTENNPEMKPKDAITLHVVEVKPRITIVAENASISPKASNESLQLIVVLFMHAIAISVFYVLISTIAIRKSAFGLAVISVPLPLIIGNPAFVYKLKTSIILAAVLKSEKYFEQMENKIWPSEVLYFTNISRGSCFWMTCIGASLLLPGTVFMIYFAWTIRKRSAETNSSKFEETTMPFTSINAQANLSPAATYDVFICESRSCYF